VQSSEVGTGWQNGVAKYKLIDCGEGFKLTVYPFDLIPQQQFAFA
jgi:hypothetical protein